MDTDKIFRNTLIKEIGIAILVLAIGSAGIFLFRSHIKESVAQINTARQELSQRTIVLNTLSRLRRQYNQSAQSYLNVLSNIVPPKDRLINISSDLQTVANQNDLGFGFSFIGETLPSGSELGYISFRLNVTGDDINQIEDFIEEIENFKFLTTVDSININRNRELEDINLIIEGKVYYQ